MMIEKIYNLYQNDKEYEDLPETIKYYEELKEAEGGKISEELDIMLNNYAALNEKQGFINGFKLAVQIMSECNDGRENRVIT